MLVNSLAWSATEQQSTPRPAADWAAERMNVARPRSRRTVEFTFHDVPCCSKVAKRETASLTSPAPRKER